MLVIVLLVAGFFVPRGPMWNADSRIFLTASIVDRGQLNIDPFGVSTGDVARAGGHYYSDKAPGLSLLAVPVYIVVKYSMLQGRSYASLLSGPPDQRIDFLPRYLMALVFAGLPTGLICMMLYTFLARLGVGRGGQTLLSLTYGLGTPALAFAGVFFGHQLAAALLFGAFYLLFRVRHGELSWHFSVLAGLLAGYAIITEYPTAIIVCALGLYYAWPSAAHWRDALNFAAGTLPALTVAGIYNTLAFGSPLSQGYAHLAGPIAYQVGQEQGFMGITHPHLEALWQTTIGPFRGLFLLSPVLLLSIPALMLLGRQRAWRREALLWVGIVVAYGLFTISYYAWDGGDSLGPRHFLPALPFLVVPLGVLVRADRTRVWRGAVAGLAAISMAIIMLAVATGPLMNTGFSSPLTQYVLPALLGLKTDPTHPMPNVATLWPAFIRSLPVFPYAVLDNNWGMLLRLPGLLQVLPLAGAVALVFVWRAWRAKQVQSPGGDA